MTHRVDRIGGHVEYEIGCRVAAGRSRAVQGLDLIDKYELVIKGTQQIVVGNVVVRVANGHSCELQQIKFLIKFFYKIISTNHFLGLPERSIGK